MEDEDDWCFNGFRPAAEASNLNNDRYIGSSVIMLVTTDVVCRVDCWKITSTATWSRNVTYDTFQAS